MQQLPRPPRLQPYVAPELPNVVPTAPGVERIEPGAVQDLLEGQIPCLLVDVRGEDRKCGLIGGAIHVPAIAEVPFITRVPELVREWASQPLVIFHCQYSAHRAPHCANWYREQAPPSQRVAILEGGFRAWEGNGLPVRAFLAQDADRGHGDDAADQAANHFAVQQGVQLAMQKQAALDGQNSLASADLPAQTVRKVIDVDEAVLEDAEQKASSASREPAATLQERALASLQATAQVMYKQVGMAASTAQEGLGASLGDCWCGFGLGMPPPPSPRDRHPLPGRHNSGCDEREAALEASPGSPPGVLLGVRNGLKGQAAHWDEMRRDV